MTGSQNPKNGTGRFNSENGDLINITGDDEVANGTFDVMAEWHIGLKNYMIL